MRENVNAVIALRLLCAHIKCFYVNIALRAPAPSQSVSQSVTVSLAGVKQQQDYHFYSS